MNPGEYGVGGVLKVEDEDGKGGFPIWLNPGEIEKSFATLYSVWQVNGANRWEQLRKVQVTGIIRYRKQKV